MEEPRRTRNRPQSPFQKYNGSADREYGSGSLWPKIVDLWLDAGPKPKVFNRILDLQAG